ncbi:MFS general substrate transporter [Basidiobolus meristosporus CBS 931.73]|uniref:MFS general substrate transporter n=1 Tax=Basidiobolus meristosporus CBS 931.73 TaxID=1314790 RepID=A0A1Y1YRG4_9FUNG|nr:MFS general substrate transporter [Basidiobolus meristosporus CBS 931.73]|eukprot:ORY00337.1 MFS general substrate transporter [Basidiobolus meristosporus CBS 931.73]
MKGADVQKSILEAPRTASNPIVRGILWHYGTTTSNRDEAQIERERYLVAGIPFNRWYLMPAAVSIQFCCGSLYAWSVFNDPIDHAIHPNSDEKMAPITFSIAIGVFGVSAATMGPWLERNGPRKAALLSSLLFYLGNLTSALAIYLQQMWLLYVGYGVIGGFGLGLGYISPVSSLQKWFPDRRGLAAGFAVCGFGAGSIAIGKVILPLIAAVGLPLTFVVLGSFYFVFMVIGACVVRAPPPGYTVTTAPVTNSEASEKGVEAAHQTTIKLTLIESIRSRDFLLLYIVFFANTMFGLVVISRLSNMITDLFGYDKNTAASIVSINGGFNLLGRILFSTISDFLGRKTCFLLMLGIQIVVMATFNAITTAKTYWAFLFIMFTLTTCYGGGFGVIPAFLADMFGSTNIGACHGVILTAWSIAGVGGGLVFTAVYNSLLSNGNSKSDPIIYTVNVYWILVFVVIGLIAGLFVRTTMKDRLLPPVPGQIFRVRVFGKMVRLVNNGKLYFERLSPEQEESEWNQYLSQQ